MFKKVESTFYIGKFSNGGGGAFAGLALPSVLECYRF